MRFIITVHTGSYQYHVQGWLLSVNSRFFESVSKDEDVAWLSEDGMWSSQLGCALCAYFLCVLCG